MSHLHSVPFFPHPVTLSLSHSLTHIHSTFSLPIITTFRLLQSGSAVSMEVSVSEGTRVRRGDAGEYLLERIDKKRDILTQFVGPTTHGTV